MPRLNGDGNHAASALADGHRGQVDHLVEEQFAKAQRPLGTNQPVTRLSQVMPIR
jgi:hypothetical protein